MYGSASTPHDTIHGAVRSHQEYFERVQIAALDHFENRTARLMAASRPMRRVAVKAVAQIDNVDEHKGVRHSPIHANTRVTKH